MFRNSIRSCICRCLYIDYFPVEDEADAQEVKQKYNGWTIERDYRYDVDGEIYYVYVKTPTPVRELHYHEKIEIINYEATTVYYMYLILSSYYLILRTG